MRYVGSGDSRIKQIYDARLAYLRLYRDVCTLPPPTKQGEAGRGDLRLNRDKTIL